MMTGGFGGMQAATNEIHALVESVKEQIVGKVGVCEKIEAVEFSQQVCSSLSQIPMFYLPSQ